MASDTVVDIETDDFNFDSWCSGLNLPRKVTQILRTEELCSREAITLMSESDFKSIGLPLGCVKLIMKDLGTLPVPSNTHTHNETNCNDSNESILQAAGKNLDSLLNNPLLNAKKDTPKFSGNQMDPRTVLTMKSSGNKAIHITQFLTEKCKRRRMHKRQEYVFKGSSGHTGHTDTLVIKTEDEHPYLGIYIEEWGAANMRLMNFLLSTGKLERQDVEYYLAYTTRIFEFAETYEWNSVLQFDYQYREQQAEHEFAWGTFSPHMELQILVTKRQRQPSAPENSRHSQQPTKPQEDCRIFKATGNCPFGENCRYKHVKQTNTHKQGHEKA